MLLLANIADEYSKLYTIYTSLLSYTNTFSTQSIPLHLSYIHLPSPLSIPLPHIHIQAADAVSDMDLAESTVRGQDQHWELLTTEAAFAVAVGAKVKGFQGFPAFPAVCVYTTVMTYGCMCVYVYMLIFSAVSICILYILSFTLICDAY